MYNLHTSSWRSTLALCLISSLTTSLLPGSACTMRGVVPSPLLSSTFAPFLTNFCTTSAVVHLNNPRLLSLAWKRMLQLKPLTLPLSDPFSLSPTLSPSLRPFLPLSDPFSLSQTLSLSLRPFFPLSDPFSLSPTLSPSLRLFLPLSDPFSLSQTLSPSLRPFLAPFHV